MKRVLSRLVNTDHLAPEDFAVDQSSMIRSGSALRALMVEDRSCDEGLCRPLLEQVGFRVDLASDAATALEKFERTDYKLVFVDGELLALDGFETIHRLRELRKSTRRIVPIVGLLGRDSKETSSRVFPIGIDAFVCKPIQASELLLAINQLNRANDPSHFKIDNPWSLDVGDIRSSYPMTQKAMDLVVTLFRESCFEKMKKIREALACHESQTIANHLHALKGSLAMFASSRTLEIVRELESIARNQRLARADGLLLILEQAILQLQPTLDLLSERADFSGLPGTCAEPPSADQHR